MSEAGVLTETRGVYKAPFTIERPEKVSQTLLAHIDRCAYSGALYVRHKGGPQTPEQARGEAFHYFVERAIKWLQDEEEPSMPEEVAKDLMQSIIEERIDLGLPAREQDACRAMAWNWGAATMLDLLSIAGVELTLEMEVGEWTVRGRLDLLSIVSGAAIVEDYKTSMKVETQEAYERSIQPQTYALLALEGVPEGEDIPLGKGLEGVHTKEVYPRYRNEDTGELVERIAYYDRAQLFDFRRTLESHLAKLEHGLETQEWVTQDSPTNCSLCPASSECPIPRAARKVTTIGTPDDALEVAQRIDFRKRDNEKDEDSLKEWVDQNGEVATSDGTWAFKIMFSERKDKEAIEAFLREHEVDPAPYLAKDTKAIKALLKERLKDNGANPDEFFKRVEATRFGKYDDLNGS